MSKKSKLTSKLFIIVSIVFVLFVTGVVLLANREKIRPKTDIVFYGIPDNQAAIISAEIQKLTDRKGKPVNYRFTSLNTSKSLQSQLRKKYDAVITYIGKSSEDAAAFTGSKAEKVAADIKLAKGMTLATSAVIQKTPEGKVSAMPLLTDVYEALINIPQKGSSTSDFTDWTALENFVMESKAEFLSPILFASSDPKTLTDITGILLLTIEGKENYYKKAQALRETISNTPQEDLEKSLSYFAGENLTEEVKKFVSWTKKDLIPRKFLSYDKESVLYLMEKASPSIVFLTLSDHRTVKQDVIEQYKSIPEYTGESHSYFPAEQGVSSLNLISPTICFVPLSTSKNAKDALDHLMMPSVQESLARRTGLAPVLAACSTPDIQSSDAQYWVAASEAPVAPLSSYSFSSSHEMEIFSTVIKEQVESLVK